MAFTWILCDFGIDWNFLLVFFSRFSIMFDISDPGIWIFISKKSILVQREIREAHFWIPNSNFSCYFFRTSEQDFERPTEISNGRPRFRPSGRDSEIPAEFPNVGDLECWKSATITHFSRFWDSFLDSPEMVGAAVQTPQTMRRSLRMTWVLNRFLKNRDDFWASGAKRMTWALEK